MTLPWGWHSQQEESPGVLPAQTPDVMVKEEVPVTTPLKPTLSPVETLLGPRGCPLPSTPGSISSRVVAHGLPFCGLFHLGGGHGQKH